LAWPPLSSSQAFSPWAGLLPASSPFQFQPCTRPKHALQIKINTEATSLE
jgi:hypothetical protein